MFTLIKTQGAARRGRFQTVHGIVETPVFMNVATVAAIKGALSSFDLAQLKCQVELCNIAKQPLFVVLDEFQVLRLTSNSILAHILREGRKHNLALLLATQTLETFNKEQVAVIRQAATQLYFRPDERCLRQLEREYMGENWVKNREKVVSFQRGECIAVGRFRMGNMIIKKPIFITFRERRM